jgi:hypothetical protein
VTRIVVAAGSLVTDAWSDALGDGRTPGAIVAEFEFSDAQGAPLGLRAEIEDEEVHLGVRRRARPATMRCVLLEQGSRDAEPRAGLVLLGAALARRARASLLKGAQDVFFVQFSMSHPERDAVVFDDTSMNLIAELAGVYGDFPRNITWSHWPLVRGSAAAMELSIPMSKSVSRFAVNHGEWNVFGRNDLCESYLKRARIAFFDADYIWDYTDACMSRRQNEANKEAWRQGLAKGRNGTFLSLASADGNGVSSSVEGKAPRATRKLALLLGRDLSWAELVGRMSLNPRGFSPQAWGSRGSAVAQTTDFIGGVAPLERIVQAKRRDTGVSDDGVMGKDVDEDEDVEEDGVRLARSRLSAREPGADWAELQRMCQRECRGQPGRAMLQAMQQVSPCLADFSFSGLLDPTDGGAWDRARNRLSPVLFLARHFVNLAAMWIATSDPGNLESACEAAAATWTAQVTQGGS